MAESGRVVQSGGVGTKSPELTVGRMVNWEFAATVGVKLARPAPPTTEYTRRQAIAELSDAARRAETPVREVTGLADGLLVPEARVLDRPGWISAAAQSMRLMAGGGEGATGFLSGRVTGAQTGAVLAFVSSGILGQYDPFTADGAGALLLVYPNVIAVERQLRVVPSDFRMWVCLHEVTHRVQFSANPWLADYMSGTLATLAHEQEEDVAGMLGRLADFVRSSRSQGQNGIVELLRAMQSDSGRDALDRLLVLGTLLEGMPITSWMRWARPWSRRWRPSGPGSRPGVHANSRRCSGSSVRSSAWTRRCASTPGARSSSTTWSARSAWSASTPSGAIRRPCPSLPRSRIRTSGSTEFSSAARGSQSIAAQYLPDVTDVAVALSGGADSLALAAAAVARAWSVTALIVDHGLQRDSAQVAARARSQALALGCADAVVLSVTVDGVGGLEAAARSARYAALEQARDGRPVLLAHTLDDQAETVLLGLGRGSGARSIAGMRPWDDPWGGHFWIVAVPRPVLPVTNWRSPPGKTHIMWIPASCGYACATRCCHCSRRCSVVEWPRRLLVPRSHCRTTVTHLMRRPVRLFRAHGAWRSRICAA